MSAPAMTDFFKMDTFFVIASVAMVVIAITTVIALVYAIRFLRTLNRISESVEEEAEAVREDLNEARAKVRSGGLRLLSLFSAFKAVKRVSVRKKRASKKS